MQYTNKYGNMNNMSWPKRKQGLWFFYIMLVNDVDDVYMTAHLGMSNMRRILYSKLLSDLFSKILAQKQ